ncbi:MAG TPA: isoprenylcysteine carboxylmethyltransferase family protein [Cyclobacteriaceae bacterium]|nr:isoprenylcysteine carboxylmethyltransferase family protein [Cyclobacteriaceae bacterium]
MKNIISFVLPVTVLILVPRWIENNWTIRNNFQTLTGTVIMLLGLSIMFVCISAFIRIGKGTLAPWSPPKNFVVTGLYRYVRNPMILGALSVLIGESLTFSSIYILQWAGTFFIINTVYFLILEEPLLEDRFGDDYREYKENVSRWLPRFTPYQLNGQPK